MNYITFSNLYTNYTQKCLANNTKPISINIVRKQAIKQAISKTPHKFIFSSDFDIYDYFKKIDFKLTHHNKVRKARDLKTYGSKKFSLAKIAEICKITASNFYHKLSFNHKLKNYCKNLIINQKIDDKDIYFIQNLLKLNKEEYKNYGKNSKS